MAHTRVTLLWVAAIALIATGCAATVARKDSAGASREQPIAVSSEAAKKIVMEIRPSPKIETGASWGAFIQEWQTAMTGATYAKGVTFALSLPGKTSTTEPAILVKLLVNDFRYVSQGSRYALGVMVGNAFLDVDAEIIEYPSGKSLATRKYSTSSSAWQGIFSAMTPKQVDAVSQEIVAEIFGK